MVKFKRIGGGHDLVATVTCRCLKEIKLFGCIYNTCWNRPIEQFTRCICGLNISYFWTGYGVKTKFIRDKKRERIIYKEQTPEQFRSGVLK